MFYQTHFAANAEICIFVTSSPVLPSKTNTQPYIYTPEHMTVSTPLVMTALRSFLNVLEKTDIKSIHLSLTTAAVMICILCCIFLTKNKIVPHLITQGNKILCISDLFFKEPYIDSLSFFQTKLANLPKSFGFENEKRDYFPHYFHTKDNLCYVGHYPKPEMYLSHCRGPSRAQVTPLAMTHSSLSE